MWFFFLIGFVSLLWLLWLIGRNTGEALDNQRGIQKELQQLNSLLTEQKFKGTQSSALSVKEAVLVEKITSNEEVKEAITLVSINDASLAKMQTLPGVGKAVAQKVINARPFKELEELTKIPGISEEFLAKLKPFITL